MSSLPLTGALSQIAAPVNCGCGKSVCETAHHAASVHVRYDAAIEAEIAQLAAVLTPLPRSVQPSPRWLAVNLLEGTLSPMQVVLPHVVDDVAHATDGARARLLAHYGEELAISIADARYQVAHDVARRVVSGRRAQPTRSDRLDGVLTHRWLGLVVFAAIMYVTFNLVQAVASPYVDWIDGVFNGPLAQGAARLLTGAGAPVWLTSLVIDGVIPGVGGVLAFVPSLLMLYLALGMLEQSGYLARAAFVMDRFMSVIGLHGKSFVPLILGFGCNVPAIYATRTIESPTARRLTALLVPFMSCTARLPIYVIFGLAFFPHRAGLVIWGLYLLGMVVAALVAAVLTRTTMRSDNAGAMIMELPPYQMPPLRAIGRQAVQRSGSFVRKAGTVILAMSVLLWLLLHIPFGVTEPRESLFGQVTEAAAPIFAPAGFGTWSATAALLSGVMAKEVVVATLAQIHVGGAEAETVEPLESPLEGAQAVVGGFVTATADAGRAVLRMVTLQPPPTAAADQQQAALTAALARAFTPLSALAFLAFVALYVPCIATIGAQSQEFGRAFAALAVVITLVVPWLVAVLIYQGGVLLGFG